MKKSEVYALPVLVVPLHRVVHFGTRYYIFENHCSTQTVTEINMQVILP